MVSCCNSGHKQHALSGSRVSSWCHLVIHHYVQQRGLLCVNNFYIESKPTGTQLELLDFYLDCILK